MQHERAAPIAALKNDVWQQKIEQVRRESLEDTTRYRQAKIAILQAAKNQIEEATLQSSISSLDMSYKERYAREMHVKEAYDRAYIEARSLRRIVWHNIEIRLADTFKDELSQILESDLKNAPSTDSIQTYDPSILHDFIEELRNAAPRELDDFLWSRSPIGLKPDGPKEHIDETPEQAAQRRKERFLKWESMADGLRSKGGTQARWRFSRVRREHAPAMNPDSVPFSVPEAFNQLGHLREIWAETTHLRIDQPSLNKATQAQLKLPHMHSVIEELMGDREQEVQNSQTPSKTDGASNLEIPAENEPLTWDRVTHVTRGYSYQL